MPRLLRLSHLALLLPLFAQEPVAITVDATSRIGPLKPIWSYFGYDEPNYTYMKHGRRLVTDLASLTWSPVYFRAHNLLTSGDGSAALKWGSTNAYTEDAQGRPVYNWTIVDRILDTYVQAGARPFVEIGFTPEALSVKPQPYRHDFPRTSVYTGWTYPPKDYAKFAELVRQWVLHSVERYGKSEVETWFWEVWNEPDISYWRGTPEEYNRLYDVSVRAVKKALPSARVGGPGTTGPAVPRAAAFLRQFLAYCAANNTPLDFISYHAKGGPKVVDGRVRMGLSKEMRDVAQGIRVIEEFPQFRSLPIYLTEADPEGCAACSVRTHPQNAYRNGTLYSAYTAAALSNIYRIADKQGAPIEAMLTWAFEFEDQPYFDGFRTLATNGIAKPVLNLFRMAGQMRGDRVRVESTGAVGLEAILDSGVAARPDIDALAARGDREVSVLAWNYHDDEGAGPDSPVKISITGLPSGAGRVLVRHYRIDSTHSNAYTVWKALGSPQNPTPEQTARLESAGRLELIESPAWVSPKDGRVELPFTLPRHAVSLVQLTW